MKGSVIIKGALELQTGALRDKFAGLDTEGLDSDGPSRLMQSHQYNIYFNTVDHFFYALLYYSH